LTPPTLDGALGVLASSAGLSFPDDIRPLLGGTLQMGVRVEPAPPLSAKARDVLERLDTSATRFGARGPRYFGYDASRCGTPTSRRPCASRTSAGLR
jgi:hypothetical protein